MSAVDYARDYLGYDWSGKPENYDRIFLVYHIGYHMEQKPDGTVELCTDQNLYTTENNALEALERELWRMYVVDDRRPSELTP